MSHQISTVQRAWLAVASADHVRRGRADGFMQVCHGKGSPLRRLRPGDGIVYYSPSETFGTKSPLRAITGVGIVKAGEPYLASMAPSFSPWRRDVEWHATREIPIASLLHRLDLSAGKRNWGYQLRFALLAISLDDYRAIAEAAAEQENPPPALLGWQVEVWGATIDGRLC